VAAALTVRTLGEVAYAPAVAAMQRFTAERNADTADEIWLLEHPPVFTLGTNAANEHVLDAGSVPVVQTDRGGQVTWHGPGQLVVYLLLDLKRLKLSVKSLVHGMEAAVIAMLHDYGIEARCEAGAPGVYVDGDKIASLGVRVKRGRCYHGLAVNVSNDPDAFSGINPCGYQGLKTLRISDLADPADTAEVATKLLPHLLRELQLEGAEVTNSQSEWQPV